MEGPSLVLTGKGREKKNELLAYKLRTVTMDHIKNCDTMQEVFADCRILEAVILKRRETFTWILIAWMETDNAGCYQYKMLAVIAPFIVAINGLIVDGIIQFEAGRQNSLGIAHFEMSVQNVKRYIRETKFSVTAPEDIVKAVQYDGCIKNNTADLVRTDRDGKVQNMWETALKDD